MTFSMLCSGGGHELQHASHVLPGCGVIILFPATLRSTHLLAHKIRGAIGGCPEMAVHVCRPWKHVQTFHPGKPRVVAKLIPALLPADVEAGGDQDHVCHCLNNLVVRQVVELVWVFRQDGGNRIRVVIGQYLVDDWNEMPDEEPHHPRCAVRHVGLLVHFLNVH